MDSIATVTITDNNGTYISLSLSLSPRLVIVLDFDRVDYLTGELPEGRVLVRAEVLFSWLKRGLAVLINSTEASPAT